MNQKNTKHLEKRILENTDRLIESAIAASLLGDEEKEKEFRKGKELIKEIARNLKDLIEVKDEYLPEILNQIISQKLPDTKVQKSLGTFTMELDRMVQLGIIALGYDTELTPSIKATQESEFTEDGQGTEKLEEIVYSECEEPLTGPCLIEDVEPLPDMPTEEEFLAVEAMSPLVITKETVDESEELPDLPELRETDESITTSTVTLVTEEIIDGILIGDLLNSTQDYALHAKTQSEYKIIEPQTPILINLLNGFEKLNSEQPQCLDVIEPTEVEQQAVSQPKEKGSPSRNLEFSLKLIFPGAEILRDVCLDGVNFAYYIPSKWLAFDQETSPEDFELKTRICRQEGIRYLIIDLEDGKNPRRVERIIQRHKINSKG
jgi:hypothetical protein